MACMKYRQQRLVEDGGLRMELRNCCHGPVKCAISWEVRCGGGGKPDAKSADPEIAAGSTESAFGYGTSCGNDGWRISACAGTARPRKLQASCPATASDVRYDRLTRSFRPLTFAADADHGEPGHHRPPPRPAARRCARLRRRAARIIAVILGTLIGLTDTIDGYLARKYGVTVLGSLLDPVADKVFIVVAYGICADMGIIPWWVPAAILSRELGITVLRLSLELRGIRLPSTNAAKAKTWVQMLGIGFVVLSPIVDARGDLALLFGCRWRRR